MLCCLIVKEIGEICVYKLRIDYVEVDNVYCRVSQSLHCLGCVWVFYIMQWCAGLYYYACIPLLDVEYALMSLCVGL